MLGPAVGEKMMNTGFDQSGLMGVDQGFVDPNNNYGYDQGFVDANTSMMDASMMDHSAMNVSKCCSCYCYRERISVEVQVLFQGRKSR